jgi:lipopolysaccharide/colanic/teichoic acid biosynthesis glycosyltransferase
VTKRAFDLILGVLALVALSPLMAAIAAWVRIDSRGPALFRQERIGRAGRPFTILKFRTMVSAQPVDAGLLTLGSDARVTRAGRFLRRTKLDELPQLVNVVRGEMSIVGPRPEVARYVALYPAPDRELILSVRPGLTDYAALAFRDESELLTSAEDAETTYTRDILPRKIALYRRYVAEQSLWLDLRLVGRTILALVRRSSPS